MADLSRCCCTSGADSENLVIWTYGPHRQTTSAERHSGAKHAHFRHLRGGTTDPRWRCTS